MKKCEKCGYENKDISNFCVKCGNELMINNKPIVPPPPPRPAQLKIDVNKENDQNIKAKSDLDTIHNPSNQNFVEKKESFEEKKSVNKRGFFKSILYFLSNILWFVFCGCIMSIYYIIKGICLFITIIGIPFGTQCFKFPKLLFAPFGKKVVTNFNKHIFLNLLWIIFGGLIEYFTFIILGIFLCITLIGIPVGLQAFKIAKLFLIPFGAKILKVEDYENKRDLSSNGKTIINNTYINTITTNSEFTETEITEKIAIMNNAILNLVNKNKKITRIKNILMTLLVVSISAILLILYCGRII